MVDPISSVVGDRARMARRTRRRWLASPEALEARQCLSGYTLGVVAQSGDPINKTTNLAGVSTNASINDLGRVAFTGRDASSAAGLFVSNAGATTPDSFHLLSGLNGLIAKSNFLGAQINNQNQVAALLTQGTTSITTTALVYSADTTGTPRTVRSASGQDTVDPYPSINNVGDVAFSGNSTSYAQNVFGITTNYLQVSSHVDNTRRTADTFTSAANMRTAISDNGLIVGRNNVGALMLYTPDPAVITGTTIASTTNFGSVGA